MQKRALEALQQASALFAAGRLEEARRACRKLLEMRPDLAEAHLLLGAVYNETGDQARARESLARAQKLRPAWSEAHLQLLLGDMLGDQGQYGGAETRYRAALRLQPGLADARYNLAGALNAMGRAEEAAAELQELLSGDPHAADAREQLVRLLQSQRRFEEMAAVCRQGMALHPGAAFYALNLGVALWWLARHDESLLAFGTAARLAGDTRGAEYAEARFLEGSCLLSLGRYAQGWRAYHWRPTRAALRARYPGLMDDPGVVAAARSPQRLCIVCEQGLGDEVFFLRFAPLLRERGHQVRISCDPRLAALLDSMPQLAHGVNPPPDAAELILASGDLPLASGQDTAAPLRIAVDAERRAAMAQRLRSFGPPPYIAVTWRAGLLPDEAKPQGVAYWAKHVSPASLGAALRSIDARVVVAQRRPHEHDLREFSEALGRTALDLGAVNDDLRDALALLDLVEEYVGVSNTNMHLRAGMDGPRTRVLVFDPPEWRWGLTGKSSPWFPGFTLYRAASGRDWSAAFRALTDDLAAALQQQ